jgi:hypothetical protein
VSNLFELIEQWCCGNVECFDCGKTWVAVWPLGADMLECPNCGGTNTDRTIEEERE